MNKKTILLLFVLMGLLSACNGQLVPEAAADFETPLPNRVEHHQDGDHAGHDHVHLDQADATAEMKVVLVPSELVVGPNRFAVGLFDAEGRMIDNGLIHFHSQHRQPTWLLGLHYRIGQRAQSPREHR